MSTSGISGISGGSKKVSPINEAVNQIRKENEVLASNIARLRAVLQPFLAPDEPTEPSVKDTDETSSPFLSDLHSIRDMIESHHNVQIINILKRLQL